MDKSKFKLMVFSVVIIAFFAISSLYSEANPVQLTESIAIPTPITENLEIQNPIFVKGQQFNKGDEVTFDLLLPLSENRDITFTLKNYTNDTTLSVPVYVEDKSASVWIKMGNSGIYGIDIYANQENISDKVEVMQSIVENHTLNSPNDFIYL